MDTLEYSDLTELIAIALNLWTQCTGTASCTQNLADIFLVTVVAVCLLAFLALLAGVVLFYALSRILHRALAKANTPGGR